MTKSPAFQFYPQDFLVGTAMMSAEEVGGYIRLLCYQWAQGPIPNNDDVIARLAGCTGNAVASIRHKFGIDPAGRLVNERLEKVRADQALFRKSQQEKAEKRWSKGQNDAGAYPAAYATASVRHMPSPCPSSSSSSSTSSLTLSSEELVGTAAPSAPAAKPKPVKVEQNDEQWLSELVADPAYSHIRIADEHAKMIHWCQVNGKQATRRRFVNWINRIERPMAGAAAFAPATGRRASFA